RAPFSPEEPVDRLLLIHDLSSRSRGGWLPRHVRASPVFAGCISATSVPRNSDHRREGAACGDGSAKLPPGCPPQGAGLWQAPMEKRPTLQRVPRVRHKISVRIRTVLLTRVRAAAIASESHDDVTFTARKRRSQFR